MTKTPRALAPPLTPPSRIDGSETDYLKALLAQLEAAQAAVNSFSGYLAGKYALTQGDTVRPDGQITRKETAR